MSRSAFHTPEEDFPFSDYQPITSWADLVEEAIEAEEPVVTFPSWARYEIPSSAQRFILKTVSINQMSTQAPIPAASPPHGHRSTLTRKHRASAKEMSGLSPCAYMAFKNVKRRWLKSRNTSSQRQESGRQQMSLEPPVSTSTQKMVTEPSVPAASPSQDHPSSSLPEDQASDREVSIASPQASEASKKQKRRRKKKNTSSQRQESGRQQMSLEPPVLTSTQKMVMEPFVPAASPSQDHPSSSLPEDQASDREVSIAAPQASVASKKQNRRRRKKKNTSSQRQESGRQQMSLEPPVSTSTQKMVTEPSVPAASPFQDHPSSSLPEDQASDIEVSIASPQASEASKKQKRRRRKKKNIASQMLENEGQEISTELPVPAVSPPQQESLTESLDDPNPDESESQLPPAAAMDPASDIPESQEENSTLETETTVDDMCKMLNGLHVSTELTGLPTPPAVPHFRHYPPASISAMTRPSTLSFILHPTFVFTPSQQTDTSPMTGQEMSVKPQVTADTRASPSPPQKPALKLENDASSGDVSKQSPGVAKLSKKKASIQRQENDGQEMSTESPVPAASPTHVFRQTSLTEQLDGPNSAEFGPQLPPEATVDPTTADLPECVYESSILDSDTTIEDVCRLDEFQLSTKPPALPTPPAVPQHNPPASSFPTKCNFFNKIRQWVDRKSQQTPLLQQLLNFSWRVLHVVWMIQVQPNLNPSFLQQLL
ncbi:nucleolar protein dao-5-like isoform X2 [Triplophysa dalaica]|uniref:nucleolar protein dao-5-like isoform X2 n=1 Tax=Triplophysa dalaica TaxID=1582913 RepID=UPI0024E0276D|nr:nucleolar protein dao-5-like isoform X2 [Triplophysa dalaica]